jgi:hypothetical protein
VEVPLNLIDIVYTGPLSGLSTLGLSRPYRFERGKPLAVAEADAEVLLEDPHFALAEAASEPSTEEVA